MKSRQNCSFEIGDPKYAGIKLFAVSGSQRDEFELRGGNRDVDRWFQKAIDPSVLLAELDHDLQNASETSDEEIRRAPR